LHILLATAAVLAGSEKYLRAFYLFRTINIGILAKCLSDVGRAEFAQRSGLGRHAEPPDYPG
jgi:hypothetical protein